MLRFIKLHVYIGKYLIRLKDFLQTIVLISLPITMSIPNGIFFYWIPSSFLTSLQMLWIKRVSGAKSFLYDIAIINSIYYIYNNIKVVYNMVLSMYMSYYNIYTPTIIKHYISYINNILYIYIYQPMNSQYNTVYYMCTVYIIQPVYNTIGRSVLNMYARIFGLINRVRDRIRGRGRGR